MTNCSVSVRDDHMASEELEIVRRGSQAWSFSWSSTAAESWWPYKMGYTQR